MRSKSWWLRAVAPAAIVGATITAVNVGLPASAAPSLSTKSPQQLLAMITQAKIPGVSGTVVEKASLGLPALPTGAGGQATSGLMGLLSGTHSLRVWVGRPGELRVQVLGALDETEVVSNGTDLWTYVYSTNQASHATIPAHTGAQTGTKAAEPLGTAPTSPIQLANQVIAAIGPSTAIAVRGTATVAHHAVYTLEIRPRTSDTTVGLVSVDVDAATGVPLRVQLFARGASSAAFSIGFSQVTFHAINASQFTFKPPAGARVSSLGGSASTAGKSSGTQSKLPESPTAPGTQPSDGSRVVGTGWASVLVLTRNPLNNIASSPRGEGGRNSVDVAGLLAKAGTRVNGGTLYHTTLVNMLATDDGRLLVGAVPLSVLQKALTAPAPAA